MKIVIHMVVSNDSYSYAQNLVRNYVELSWKPELISFKVYCLDKKVYRKLSKSNLAQVFLVHSTTTKGSFGHALGLAMCLKNLDQGALNVISDTDVCVVKNNWDELLRELFYLPESNLESTKGGNALGILGTTYEDYLGFSTGSSIVQTYKGSPTLTWCALSPNYNFTTLNVFPEKQDEFEISSHELSNVYGLPIGFRLLKDVGWQLPLFLHDNKIPFRVFQHIKPNSSHAVVLNNGYSYHDEFHLNNQAFLVHQRGSMKHSYRLDKISKDFYLKVSVFLNNPEWMLNPSKNDYLKFGFNKFRRFLRKIRIILTKIIK
jgi:hypothetical protein